MPASFEDRETWGGGGVRASLPMEQARAGLVLDAQSDQRGVLHDHFAHHRVDLGKIFADHVVQCGRGDELEYPRLFLADQFGQILAFGPVDDGAGHQRDDRGEQHQAKKKLHPKGYPLGSSFFHNDRFRFGRVHVSLFS